MINWILKLPLGVQIVLMTIAGTIAIFAGAFALGAIIN